MFDTEKFICEIEVRPPLYDVKCKLYSNREVKAKCWCEVGRSMFDDWDEIGIPEKDERVKDLMKKWKAIRDAFVKDHKLVTAVGTGQAATSKKRYVFYDQLLFLLPNVKGNMNTSSNIEPPTSQPEDETSTQNIPDINESGQSAVKEWAVPSMSGTSKTTSPLDKRALKRKISPTKRFPSQSALAGKRLALESSVASSAKELTSILSKSLEMQKDERTSDKYGHKAFLLSFAPVLNSLPLTSAMYLRGQIADNFTNFFRQSSTTDNSPMSLTPSSPIINDDNEPSEYFTL